MTNGKQIEGQNKRDKLAAVLSRSLATGFWGGILWSVIAVVMYYFNFIEVAPKTFFITSWTTAKWGSSWLGDIISILIASVLSVAIAFIYFGLLKKVNSKWMGLVYGLVLWGVIFYLLQPIFSMVPALTDFNKDTIISTICLFMLYGTFIGHSISFDYQSMLVDTKKQKQKRKR